MERREKAERQRQHCHAGLRDEHQLAPVQAIGNGPARQRKDQRRHGAQKAVQPQQKRGVGHHQDLPAEREVLHPGADVGEEISGPEKGEVAVTQGAKHRRHPALFGGRLRGRDVGDVGRL